MSISKCLITMVFVSMVLLPSVIANEIMIPVANQVSVDFQGDRDFRLIMSNGYERHFYWDANETHSDVTFQHTIYHPINLTTTCSNNMKISQYETINSGLVDMLGVCKDTLRHVNKTDELQNEKIELVSQKVEYEKLWKIEEDQRKKYEEQYKDCNGDLADVRKELKTTEKSLSSEKSSSIALSECKKDLQEEEDGNGTDKLVFLLIGLGIGWALWRKKKTAGPSEQNDRGNSGDAIVHREYAQERLKSRRLDDGPRE